MFEITANHETPNIVMCINVLFFPYVGKKLSLLMETPVNVDFP